jgi:hypothetical protein
MRFDSLQEISYAYRLFELPEIFCNNTIGARAVFCGMFCYWMWAYRKILYSLCAVKQFLLKRVFAMYFLLLQRKYWRLSLFKDEN